ncbi:MAG: transporter substrate-binding domain-containing protein [Pseudomonadota bacterium]
MTTLASLFVPTARAPACKGKAGAAMLAALIVGCALAPARAQPAIVLGKSDSSVTRISEAIVREAYARVGVALQVRQFPSERSLQEANIGRLDGDMTRIAGIEERYPNLLRVPVPVLHVESLVYTNRAQFEVKGWDSLRPYRIGIRLGIKFAEDGTRGMQVQVVPSNEQLFTKLELGRTDVIVSTRIEGSLMMKKLNTRHVRALAPALGEVTLYHYLHKRNAALVPKIAAALRAMEQEGRMQAIERDELARMVAQVASP